MCLVIIIQISIDAATIGSMVAAKKSALNTKQAMGNVDVDYATRSSCNRRASSRLLRLANFGVPGAL
jgi:hypothetical protein